MSATLELYLLIAVVVAAAKAAGWASSRVGQPAVLGELLVGLLLGPTAINLLHVPGLDHPVAGQTLSELANLGVLFLMFVAGMEVDASALRRTGRVSILAGTLGVVLPILVCGAIGLAAGMDYQHALVLGLTMGATSVSISAQTLIELGVLQTSVGVGLLGAAVADDVLVIVLLSLSIALLTGGGGGALGVLWLLVRMALFFGVVGLGGRWLLPRIASRVARLPVSEGVVAFAVVVALLLGWAAEEVGGVAAITGAFLAGLLFGRTTVRAAIERGMHTLTYALLVPIFFVSIGLQLDARALGNVGILFLVAISFAAILSKLLGSGLGALAGGFGLRDAARLGIGMVSRGEVGLIVVAVALESGLADESVLSVVVVVVLVTTIVTPVLLRALYPRPAPARTGDAQPERSVPRT